MAMSAKLYGALVTTLFTAGLNFSSDTIKVSLHTSAYTPNQDTDDFFNDCTNEVVGTGYTAGGATLGSKTLTYDGATNTLKIDGADTTWSTSTITAARWAVIYKSTGIASTSPLIGYINLDVDRSSVAGNFTLIYDATGIATATLA